MQAEILRLLQERDEREILPFESILTQKVNPDKAESLARTVAQKNKDITNLVDELAVHKLELNYKDAQLESLEQKLKQTTTENQQLVEKIVKMKEEQVAKLNEVNEFVESSLRARPASNPVDKTEKKMHCYLPQRTTRIFPAHEAEVHCIQVSPDGNFVATGSQDKRLNLFDSKTGLLHRSLTGSLQGITSISFNASNDQVLGTSADNSIKIWNLQTYRMVHSLTGHIGKVFAAQFTSTGKVVSCSHDRTIKIFDLQKGFCSKTIFTLSSCNDLALLDSDGTVIASGHLDSSLRFWDSRTGSVIKEISSLHSGQITSVQLNPGILILTAAGYQLLTTSRDNNMKLIDCRMYESIQTYSHPNFRIGLNWTRSCFSSDGTYVASGSLEGSLYVWNTLNSTMEKSLTEHKSPVVGVVWNPQGGNVVYSAEKDHNVCIYGTPL